jgi:hypothetical protein
LMTMPVGTCRRTTQLALLLTFWPPLPLPFTNDSSRSASASTTGTAVLCPRGCAACARTRAAHAAAAAVTLAGPGGASVSPSLSAAAHASSSASPSSSGAAAVLGATTTVRALAGAGGCSPPLSRALLTLRVGGPACNPGRGAGPRTAAAAAAAAAAPAAPAEGGRAYRARTVLTRRWPIHSIAAIITRMHVGTLYKRLGGVMRGLQGHPLCSRHPPRQCHRRQCHCRQCHCRHPGWAYSGRTLARRPCGACHFARHQQTARDNRSLCGGAMVAAGPQPRTGRWCRGTAPAPCCPRQTRAAQGRGHPPPARLSPTRGASPHMHTHKSMQAHTPAYPHKAYRQVHCSHPREATAAYRRVYGAAAPAWMGPAGTWAWG